MAMEISIAAGEMISPSAERTKALNVFCESKTTMYEIIVPHGWEKSFHRTPLRYQRNGVPYVMGTEGAADRVFDRLNDFCHEQEKTVKEFLYGEDEPLRRAAYWKLKSEAFKESRGGAK